MEILTADMKKAIQNEVKKQLGILKENDSIEKKVLTPYQKTIKLLKSSDFFSKTFTFLSLSSSLAVCPCKRKTVIIAVKIAPIAELLIFSTNLGISPS